MVYRRNQHRRYINYSFKHKKNSGHQREKKSTAQETHLGNVSEENNVPHCNDSLLIEYV